MKKQYITPAMETVQLNLKAGILFGSGDGETLNGGGNLGTFGGGSVDAPGMNTEDLVGLPPFVFE